MKGLLAILGKPMVKDKGAAPSEEEAEEAAPESGASVEEYKKLIADAAKDGDWDGFADAVAGLVSCSK